MPLDRPIPAFYCCYLLRSTVKRSSVYVGSTPNPVRRLKQHNGLSKGGAVRTSRASMRPWEMSCIVTGFPSQIAALQFEWAWQNPHVTQHIAPEARIQHATQKKRSGQPKRPRHTVISLLSNLHLLLRSPSFSRWPLELRFFSPDVHKAWTKWTKEVAVPIRDTLPLILDFPPDDLMSSGDESKSSLEKKIEHGIAALPVDYTVQKPYVVKSKDVIDFEREGSCAVCNEELEHDEGIYTICPSPGCESVTHMTCLSKHFLSDDEESLVPIKGNCPSCKAELRWVDVVKELSLRMRGQKEVEKLLKVKRVRKTKAATASQSAIDSSEEEDEDEVMEDFIPGAQGVTAGDDWHVISDSELSDVGSVKSTAAHTKKGSSYASKSGVLGAVVEDSDWEGAEILD